MTREEFFEWLNTCPTHKFVWEMTAEGDEYVVVSFPITEDDEEND
jgi:hypothetical protein